MQKLEENGSAAGADLSAIEKALWQELSFQDTISTEVVAAILDHVVVCEGSTKQKIDLELYLRLGQTASVTFSRERFAFWNTFFHDVRHKTQVVLDEHVARLKVARSEAFQIRLFLGGGERARE